MYKDHSPLNELVVITAFANNQDAYLDLLTKEEEAISNTLRTCRNISHISIPNATVDDIFNSFNQNWNKVGILHYAGHASGTHLQLEDKAANAQGIGSLIREHGSLPLVFLNGCSTTNQAQLLLDAGVAIVIATKVAVDDQSAMLFADRFYKTLAQNHTIDKAFKDAKNFLLAGDYKTDEQFEYKRRDIGWPGVVVSPIDTAWTIHVGDENALFLTLGQLANYIERQRLLLPYAHWLVLQHSRIPMTGLKGTTEISLDKVFVSLRGELSKSYEILQTQKYYAEELANLEASWEHRGLSDLEKKQHRSRLLGRTAIMPSIDERDMRYQRTNEGGHFLNLAEAFIRYNKLVVLGDPGTGKTTLARWLVLMFAKSIIEGKDRVEVPAALVNATNAKTYEKYDFGPIRLPILLRVGELAQQRQENPDITLTEFIGHQSWMGRYPYYNEESSMANEPISPEALNALMHDFISNGEALFILDGLDEISEDQERKDMVRVIQEFIDRSIDASRGKQLNRQNKLLITSRIAGYHTCPVQHEELFHVTIQAMAPRAIEHFCSTWLKAAHYSSNEERKKLQMEIEAIELQQQLSSLIFAPNQTGARDLASNPLLLTELCKVFYAEDQKLPSSRVELYEKAAENFFKVGEVRLRNQQRHIERFREKTFYILEDIAEHIHENYPVGLIITEEVEILTRKALKSFYSDAGQEQALAVIEGEVLTFLKWLREDVGILAARAEELYGFLHLSFEEYFAARKLIRYPERITKAIINRAYQPRWREPLLMAIGTMNQRLLKKDRDEVLVSLMNIPDPMGNLVPRSANLIALSFAEMDYQPDGDLIRDVVIRLLKAYEKTESFQDGNILRSNVIETFQTFNLKGKEIYLNVIEVLDFIIKSPSFEQSMKNAVVDLLLHLKWRNQTLINGVIENRKLDSMDWGWPFHKTIQVVAREEPELLRHPSFEFRTYLQDYPDMLEKIKEDQVWSRIIIVLYVGLLENDKTFELTAEGIIQDSLLTEDIIDALEEDQPAGSLETHCFDIWRSEQAPQEKKIDALLYLAALGTPIVRELKQIANAPGSPIAKALTERLSLMHQLLGKAVGAVAREMSSLPESLVQDMNAESIQQFVNNVVLLTISYDEQVSSPVVWIKAMPKERQAITLAELWVHGFANANDPLYGLAVTLDTSGKVIQELGPEVVARSFAEINNVFTLPPHDVWPVERVPYQPKEMQDILEEALTNIDAIKPSFDLFKFWALKEIKPLIDQFPDSNLKWMISRVIRNIKNIRFLEASVRLYFPEFLDGPENEEGRKDSGAKSHFLSLENENQEKPPFFLISKRKLSRNTPQSLKEEYGKRPDKYLRTLFGVLTALRGVGKLQFPGNELEASGLYQVINSCLAEADRCIALLDTPDLRVKGWLKLASFYPKDERSTPILKALDALQAIEAGPMLVLMLREVKPWVINSTTLSKRYLQQTQRLEKTQHRAMLENRYYPQFLELPDLPENNVKLALLALGALIQDGNQIFTLPENTQELWELIQRPDHPQLPEIIEKLKTRGKKNMLSLSLRGALAITDLLQQERMESIDQLMTVISKPTREAVSVVINWLDHPSERIKCFTSLLLLESGILNAATFPYVEKILFGSFEPIQDQFRKRANVALNQSYFYASEMGLECLYMIQKAIYQHGNRTPYLVKGLSWIYEYLHFDDASILETLIKDAEGSGRKARLARGLIRSIHYLDGEDTYALYLSGFYHEDSRIVTAFLYSSVFLQHLLTRTFLMKNLTNQLKAALIHCIRSEDVETQNFAIDSFGYSEDLKEEDIQLLKDIIKSSGESQQYRAIVTLGRMSYQEEESFVLALLKNSNANIRKAAAEAICRYAIRQGGEDFSKLITTIQDKIEDATMILPGILDAAQDLWYGPYTIRACKFLGYYFEENPKLFQDFMKQCEEVLNPMKKRGETFNYTEQYHWMQQMVWLDGLAAGAEKLPSTYMRQAKRLPDFEGILQRIVYHSSIFTDRMNAVKCLSLLRKMSPLCTQAYMVALKDITYVQEEAIFSAQRFQEIDKHFVQALSEMLDRESLSARYTVIQILAAIGNYPKTESDTRQEILKVMLSKIDEPGYSENVYLLRMLENSSGNGELTYVGPLNHEIYRKILEVSGVKAKVQIQQ